jgi:hypothetical protein
MDAANRRYLGFVQAAYGEATERPTCPDCGHEMRQTRRGATLARRGPAYICPVAESEVYADGRGHLHRIDGAQHDRTRSWSPAELEATEPAPIVREDYCSICAAARFDGGDDNQDGEGPCRHKDQMREETK